MRKKFIRQDYMRHLKIGKKRKKLQKWRKPKGRHSKMREKRKGYPISPSIGYKSQGKTIPAKLINNMSELKNLKEKSTIIIAKKVGAKKKMEIIKLAQEKKIKILNVKGRKNET